MLRIFTHNNGSQGLSNLRGHLDQIIREMNESAGIRNLRPIMGSTDGQARLFRNGSRMVLNWGSSATLNNNVGNLVLNEPDAVGQATHKLRFFQRINAWNQENENRAVPIPEWTTSRDQAQTWAGNDHLVYARQRLQGHSGEGIEVYRINQVVERAPLYTKGIVGARREYRVHVVGGKVALVQLKKRRNGAGTATGEADTVRNLDSGWVYAVSDARPSRIVLEAAVNAIAAIGLDFGAVDIIAKGRKGGERECWVLEVNTAPGQRGDTTVTVYARGIAALYAQWLAHKDTQNVETIKAMWQATDWQNNGTFEMLLRNMGVNNQTVSTLIRADNETHNVTNGDDEDGTDNEVAADENFALEAEPVVRQVAPQDMDELRSNVNPRATRQVRFGEMPGNPFARPVTAQAVTAQSVQAVQEPVTMPERVVGVSRLGRNDPQNEQFVVFNWNNRREVGVVNTQRGVVYIAGSDMPIAVGSVDLIAVVDTEIR